MFVKKLSKTVFGLLSFVCLGSFPANALTVTHEFSTHVNGISFGSGSNELVTVRYSFDNASAPIDTVSYSGGGAYSVYGGVQGSILFGRDTVTFSNATISVYDDQGTPRYNGQVLQAKGSLGATFNGSVNGRSLSEMWLSADLPFATLGSTSIVSSPSVLNNAASHRFWVISNTSTGSLYATNSASKSGNFSTPAPVPLPASGWLLIGGLGTMAALRRRKASRARTA